MIILGYIIGILISIVIIFRCYHKIKNPFWSIQPVFRPYNIYYKWFPPGIIESHNNDNLVPQRKKYINTTNIIIKPMTSFSLETFEEIATFIRKFYCNEKNVFYNPKANHILPYFHDSHKSNIGLYYLNNQLFGCITTKPLYVEINNQLVNTHYVDYLCIHKEHRGKGLAPELIQTISNYVKKKDKLSSTFIFKRETTFNTIVPLTKYDTYAYDLTGTSWDTIHTTKNQKNQKNQKKQENFLPSGISLIKITTSHINILFNFLKIKKNNYKIYICENLSILIELIKTENIFVFCLIQENEILAAYFFKNATTMYKNKRSMECFCTLNNSIIAGIFVLGFYKALEKMVSIFPILLLENTADSNIIIEKLHQFHRPDFTHKMAYYYYNFAINTVNSNNTCLIF